jgi:HK97 family phage major capsid protein
MKVTRNLLVTAMLFAVAAVSIAAEAFAPGAVAGFIAAHPDVAIGLSSLAFIGDTKGVTLEEVKEVLTVKLGEVTKEYKEAAAKAGETAAKALEESKRLGTLTGETNDLLKKNGEAATKAGADMLEMQQKMEKFGKIITAFGGDGDGGFKSISQIVIESDQFKAAGTSGKPMMDAVKVGSFHKTAIVNATGASQPLVAPQRADFVKPADRPLVVRDLLPIRGTTANLIQFAKENVFTNNAAVVYDSPNYENVTKPESAITYTLAEASVQTLAHWIPASRQVLADAPMLQGMIEDRLMYGLKYVEEDEILNGAGGAGHLNGLMTQATAYAGSGAVSADTQLDTLLRAMTQVFTGSLFNPDGVILNPVDWMKIRLIKDTTGRYIFGDPHSVSGGSVWGQRVVSSLSIAATRFLVGNFQAGAAIWDREDATIRIAEQHANFFIQNMVAILAEERLALTVYRPTAFVRGNFN